MLWIPLYCPPFFHRSRFVAYLLLFATAPSLSYVSSEIKPLYRVVPQAAASVGGAMMGSEHVYDIKGAVPVAVGSSIGAGGLYNLMS